MELVKSKLKIDESTLVFYSDPNAFLCVTAKNIEAISVAVSVEDHTQLLCTIALSSGATMKAHIDDDAYVKLVEFFKIPVGLVPKEPF